MMYDQSKWGWFTDFLLIVVLPCAAVLAIGYLLWWVWP
jgi:hypothetical protein